MIHAGLVLFAISLYFALTSEDVIEFGVALLRVVLTVLLLVFMTLDDPGILEGAVLTAAVLLLAFLALIRNEVQVDHDQS
jgi:hypothetical protein